MVVPRYLAVGAFFVLLTMALLPPSPSGAQSASASASPGGDQYGVSTDGANAAADAGDIPPAVTDDVADGSDAVNNAMGDDAPPSAQAAPSDGSAPSEGSAPPDEDAPSGEAFPSAGTPEVGLTALPETGGAPVWVLCAGAALLGCGLLLLRSNMRED